MVSEGSALRVAAPSTSARAGQTRRFIGSVFFAVVTIGLAAIFVFPFFWTVSSSLKTPVEIFSFPPTMLPAVPQWGNYLKVMTKVPYLTWVGNSLFVVIASTLGVILTSSIVAYSFARFEYRGRDLIFVLTLGTMMLPAQVTLIPQFVLFNAIGWINTLNPLWVPHWFGGAAFYIFLLRQFIMSLPRELDEAATIDGASYFRVFWGVLMPLMKPALATVAIISFIGGWNDFLTPLIYLSSEDKFTVAVGLDFFQNVPESAGEPTQHLLMAASVIAILPCLVLFFSAQRYFIEGIVLSGIKG
ncbi:MAG TPA: carbohydrate ABC transporter permease [Chloroflexota bacterium]|nr:carbohydrate ABC transporter permease [Chloroflexota bacterium]